MTSNSSLCERHTYDYASNEIHHWTVTGAHLNECNRPAYCDANVPWGSNGRTAGACKRRGYKTYVGGERAIRCWQHDPLRVVEARASATPLEDTKQ